MRKWLQWFLAFSVKKWTKDSAPKTVTLSITLTKRQYNQLLEDLAVDNPYKEAENPYKDTPLNNPKKE
jgi:hypothetical protein